MRLPQMFSMVSPGFIKSAVMVFGLSAVLSGCAFMHDRSNDYVDAKRETKLVVPPWYSKSGLKDDYPVAHIDQETPLARKFELPRPPDAELEILAEQYSIRHAEQQVWLLINEEPGRVWPALTRFWENNGLRIPFTAPKSGLMQTSVSGNSVRSRDLLKQLGLNPDAQYFFVAHLDQGLKRRTTEVSVRVVQGSTQSDDLNAAWKAASPQESTEEKLLGSIQQFLEKDESNRSYSLLAQDLTGRAKVVLRTEEDPPYLRLDLGFERAWNAVGTALTDGEVPVADLNRSTGTYLVYFDPSDHSHFWLWSWMFPKTDNKFSDRYNFRVILERNGDVIKVRTESTDGHPDRDMQIKLLTRILDNIA